MTSVGDGGGLNRRMTAIPAAHLRHGNSYSRMLDSDVAFVHPRVPNVASNSYEGNFMCSVVVFPSRFGSQTIRHACVTCIISRVIRRMNLGPRLLFITRQKHIFLWPVKHYPGDPVK